MLGPLLPWEVISIVALTITALIVIFNYLRTPVWMLVWIIIIGISLYLLPSKLKGLGPASIGICIYMYKKLGDVNS